MCTVGKLRHQCSKDQKDYPLDLCAKAPIRAYLTISGRSYDGSIISEGHDSGLEDVVQMTRRKCKVPTFCCPIPNYDFFVIRSRDEKVTCRVEMYSVHTTLVTT